MKKFIIFVLTLMSMMTNAVAVEIDGIYYQLEAYNYNAKVISNPSKYHGDITIPETVTYEGVEYHVTSIKGSAFKECSALTSVIIPNSVTNIGSYAFFSVSKRV